MKILFNFKGWINESVDPRKKIIISNLKSRLRAEADSDEVFLNRFLKDIVPEKKSVAGGSTNSSVYEMIRDTSIFRNAKNLQDKIENSLKSSNRISDVVDAFLGQ